MSANFYRPDLAHIHDSGFGAVAAHAATVLLAELRRRKCDDGTVVDLGCGSGVLAAATAKAGHPTLGIDLSPAMIELARSRAPQAEFRVGSLFTAALPKCVAVAAVGEALNYVFGATDRAAELPRLFRRAHAALAPGGLFLFDVATPGRIPGGFMQRCVTGADWAVFVENREDRKTRLLTRKIISFRQAGELYRRDDEVHRQCLLAPAETAKQLRAAAFRVRRLSGYGTLAFPRGVAGFLGVKLN